MPKETLTRREYREQAMIFLYILEMGGVYEREAINDEVYESVNDLICHTDEIEEILSKSIVNYTLKSLNAVDQAILKFAVYEMKFKETPYQVAINEALEITKLYSDLDGKQVSFNNKVLDKAKDLII